MHRSAGHSQPETTHIPQERGKARSTLPPQLQVALNAPFCNRTIEKTEQLIRAEDGYHTSKITPRLFSTSTTPIDKHLEENFSLDADGSSLRFAKIPCQDTKTLRLAGPTLIPTSNLILRGQRRSGRNERAIVRQRQDDLLASGHRRAPQEFSDAAPKVSPCCYGRPATKIRHQIAHFSRPHQASRLVSPGRRSKA